jgi:H+/Cl- antiporter ClcA
MKKNLEQIPIFTFTVKWLLIAVCVGILAGAASALFLVSLAWCTNYREQHFSMIALLPIAGLLIGFMYHYLGKDVVKGNNQIIEETLLPQKVISPMMAVLVLIGTLLTHLFGGSAGREGTAVQMASSLADQLTKLFRLQPQDRKILLAAGISAGFAAVFGTPLAGTIFALEVIVVGRMRYEALLPALFSAFIANYVCHACQVEHTHYAIFNVPSLSFTSFLMAIVAGIAFGWAGLAFAQATHFWGDTFKKYINYPPLRPFLGGVVIAAIVLIVQDTTYIGLGVPTIVASFDSVMPLYAFVLKIAFTSFTLGAGFKGGEVTPLFFTGATLGSALSLFLPLPTDLLAGMGFVAVFAAATNTPIACLLMGIELFGSESAAYLAIACVVAYFFSGHNSIYASQVIGTPKHARFLDKKSQKIVNK